MDVPWYFCTYLCYENLNVRTYLIVLQDVPKNAFFGDFSSNIWIHVSHLLFWSALYDSFFTSTIPFPLMNSTNEKASPVGEGLSTSRRHMSERERGGGRDPREEEEGETVGTKYFSFFFSWRVGGRKSPPSGMEADISAGSMLMRAAAVGWLQIGGGGERGASKFQKTHVLEEERGRKKKDRSSRQKNNNNNNKNCVVSLLIGKVSREA